MKQRGIAGEIQNKRARQSGLRIRVIEKCACILPSISIKYSMMMFPG
jgi:hypothetical protein